MRPLRARHLAALGELGAVVDIVVVGAVRGAVVGLRPLGEALVAVDRGDGEIGGAVENHHPHRPGERAHGGVGRIALGGGIRAAARHRGEGRGLGGGRLELEPRMDADGGEHVGIGGAHDRRHAAAGREAGQVDLGVVDGVLRL